MSDTTEPRILDAEEAVALCELLALFEKDFADENDHRMATIVSAIRSIAVTIASQCPPSSP